MSVSQDGRLARGIFLNAIGTKRGIDRDRHAARQKHAEETPEKFHTSWQHKRDGTAAFQSRALQRGRNCFGALQ